MGGGPRTYPGGVSKWQWKRMQAKKAKQLLKARLARERQIYEMRKRAELKAAAAELERPWEPVEKPPKLFSVSADEQLKVLADRFQMPGGFDLWTDRDGPQVFNTVDGVSSARFFPKGVVHSVKPYGRIGDGRSEFEGEGVGEDSGSSSGGELGKRGGYGRKKRGYGRSRLTEGGVDGRLNDSGLDSSSSVELENRDGGYQGNRRGYGRRAQERGVDGGLSDSGFESGSGVKLGRINGGYEGKSRGYGRRVREKDGDEGLSDSGSESDGWDDLGVMRVRDGKRSVGIGMRRDGNRRIGRGVEDQRQVWFDRKPRGVEEGRVFHRRNNGGIGGVDRQSKMNDLDSQVYDMNLQNDGSYGL